MVFGKGSFQIPTDFCHQHLSAQEAAAGAGEEGVGEARTGFPSASVLETFPDGPQRESQADVDGFEQFLVLVMHADADRGVQGDHRVLDLVPFLQAQDDGPPLRLVVSGRAGLLLTAGASATHRVEQRGKTVDRRL